MPATGIFYVPAQPGIGTGTDSLSALQLLFNNLLTSSHHLEPLPGWTLEHRLFRETAPANEQVGPEAAASLGLVQVLTISHVKGSFAAVTRNERGEGDFNVIVPAPSSLVRLPAGPAAEEFVSLMVTRMTPLWTRRQTLAISGGQAFRVHGEWSDEHEDSAVVPTSGASAAGKIPEGEQLQAEEAARAEKVKDRAALTASGEVVMRFGEVREARAGGGQPVLRGTLAEVYVAGQKKRRGKKTTDEQVETKGDENEEALRAVRAFWDEMGIVGGKAYAGTHSEGNEEAGVRLWLDALRPRV